MTASMTTTSTFRRSCGTELMALARFARLRRASDHRGLMALARFARLRRASEHRWLAA
jgi:hypothetical protein